MPRIPVRTEPYSSPSRQHRHYKNKRDQVLRALGKAAYINGSHFAIMWVTASGQSEVYASDAFQPRIDDWFETSGMREEGVKLVLERGNHCHAIKGKGLDASSGKAATNTSGQADDDDGEDGDEGDDDDGDEDLSDHEGPASGRASPRSKKVKSNAPTPLIACNDDVFGSTSAAVSPAPPTSMSPSGRPGSSQSTSADLVPTRLARKALAPIDINTTNKQFSHQLLNTQKDDVDFMRAPKSAPLPNSDGGKPLMRAPSSTTVNPSKLLPVTLADRAARTAFFELRFGQMQQGMCKTVAKAWIKIIEPKKQTRCPYNKGEEGKPDWWPEGVRHKEPDHLMKPERHALLLAILRSPKVKVARLQLATAEVVAMIRADKVSLLMDLYRIAREEERLTDARAETADTEPITVGVSTLAGWKPGGGLDEAGKLATLGEDSPEVDDKPAGRNSKAAAKKRRPSTLGRSVSSTNVEKKQRLSISAGASSGKTLAMPEAVALQRSHSHSDMPLNNSMVTASSLVDSPNRMIQAWSHQASMPGYSPLSTQAGPSGHAHTRNLQYQLQQQQQPTYQQYAAQHLGNEHSPFLGSSAGSSPHFVQQGFAPPNQRLQYLSQQHQPGSLSAPQGSHVPLYPVGARAGAAAGRGLGALEPSSGAGRTSSSVRGSPVPNYNFHFSSGSEGYENTMERYEQQQSNVQQQHHQQAQQQSPLFAEPQSSSENQHGSALGLTGVPTGMTSWNNPFDPAYMPWGPQQQQQPQQPQHDQPRQLAQQQQQPLPSYYSAPARHMTLPFTSSSTADESLEDISAGDLSFASTAGPMTPQHGHAHGHATQQLNNQQHLALQKLAQQHQMQDGQLGQQVQQPDLLTQMYGGAVPARLARQPGGYVEWSGET
ncbi:hypothetical protein BDZ90DRAFT_257401 [Jaminaea rosea]|uniref:Subtelomeric hrmA-associated cluster protein AFUB-079030/YDR124W-like helical bundle domain-containing protein n=1 Tax=Jaminaea rosea TaxID=1569628 RepID=A0A316UYE1_9BASI|nr:hypothetical protein BDZ90DRAFT_257401 [Jaminaea rosea]PWN30319.1 hypothetical protein BDZ90DRAFT_257401 [Jaminaea rosea]